jgi:hypothetical protein
LGPDKRKNHTSSCRFLKIYWMEGSRQWPSFRQQQSARQKVRETSNHESDLVFKSSNPVKIEGNWDIVVVDMKLDQSSPLLKVQLSREDAARLQAHLEGMKGKGVELERALSEMAMLELRLSKSDADSKQAQSEVVRLETELAKCISKDRYAMLQDAYDNLQQNAVPKYLLDSALQELTSRSIEVEAMKAQIQKSVYGADLDAASREIARLQATVNSMVSREDHEAVKLANAQARDALKSSALSMSGMVPKQDLEYALGEIKRLESELLTLAQQSGRARLGDTESKAAYNRAINDLEVERSKVDAWKGEAERLKELVATMVPRSEFKAAMEEASKLRQQHSEARKEADTLRMELDTRVPVNSLSDMQQRVRELEMICREQAAGLNSMAPREDLERAIEEKSRLKGRLAAVEEEAARTKSQLGDCVSKREYDVAVREADALRDRLAAMAAQAAEMQAALANMVPRADLDSARAVVSRLEGNLMKEMDRTAGMVSLDELQRCKQENARLQNEVRSMVPAADHEALQQAYAKAHIVLQTLPPREALDDAQRRVIECEREIEDLKRFRSELVPKEELERVTSDFEERIRTMVPVSELLRCMQEKSRLEDTMKSMVPASEFQALQKGHTEAHKALQALPPKQAFDDAQRRVIECEREIEDLKRQRSEMVLRSELEHVSSEYRERMAAMVPMSELQDCKQELATLQKAHAKTHSTLQALPSKQAFDDAQLRVIECDRAIEDLKRQLSEMVPKAELERLTGDHRERMATMVPASELQRFKQEIARLEDALRDAVPAAEHERLQQAHAKARNTLQSLPPKQALDDAQRRVVECEQEIEDLKRQRSEMVPKAETERAMSKISKLEGELAAAFAEVARGREQLKESVPKSEHQLVLRTLSLEQERAGTSTMELQQMKKDIEKMAPRAELEQALREVDRLKGMLDGNAPRESVEQLKRQLEEAMGRANAHSAQLSGTVQGSELETARREVRVLEERLATMSQEAVQAKAKLDGSVPKSVYERLLAEAAELSDRAAANAAETERLRSSLATRAPSEVPSVQAHPKQLQKMFGGAMPQAQVAAQPPQPDLTGGVSSPQPAPTTAIGPSPSIVSPMRKVPTAPSTIVSTPAASKPVVDVDVTAEADPPPKLPPVLSPGFMPGASKGFFAPDQLRTPIPSPVLQPSSADAPPHLWV